MLDSDSAGASGEAPALYEFLLGGIANVPLILAELQPISL